MVCTMRRHWRSTPSPACGGGLGWGLSPHWDCRELLRMSPSGENPHPPRAGRCCASPGALGLSRKRERPSKPAVLAKSICDCPALAGEGWVGVPPRRDCGRCPCAARALTRRADNRKPHKRLPRPTGDVAPPAFPMGWSGRDSPQASPWRPLQKCFASASCSAAAARTRSGARTAPSRRPEGHAFLRRATVRLPWWFDIRTEERAFGLCAGAVGGDRRDRRGARHPDGAGGRSFRQ